MPEPEPLLGVRNFRVFLGSVEVGFCHVEGLASESLIDELSGERVERWTPVVLRRALGTDRSLFEWRERAAGGRPYPRDVGLDQLDPAGERCVNTFVLSGAWPTRWSGPVLDAGSDSIALEELELSYERLLWMKEPAARTSRRARAKQRSRGRDGRSA